MVFRSSKASQRLDDISTRRTANLSTETLIVWQEPGTGLDMALSFQEAEGCALIWLVLIVMTGT